jgi:serine/threonine protein kinase
MSVSGLTGQILDEKYRIEQELGRGGMGSVYLATHLGTERPVAVKVISHEFMSHPEFIERFRREARAAGRLRHPNVVDVTDFGFATTKLGRVAYLVMEYLDGCTLGEILEEERNLPLDWSLDILEQVCSAVQEAHSQGIIHRDLKPDNIWLEPNQRGGYNVKVLDFGIAKLEDPSVSISADSKSYEAISTLADISVEPTVSDQAPNTIGVPVTAPPASDTPASESSTIIQTSTKTETDTAIIAPPPAPSDPETVGTLIASIDDEPKTIDDRSLARGGGRSTVSDSTSGLTRVGAVLGTPLYMSPEQCNGERLDARSDVYSIGVIAYQMLSGATPFSGDFTAVMDAHRSVPPPPLEVKGLRKKVKDVVEQALAKNPSERPQTAEVFAAELRAQSEGIGNLLQRALTVYIARLPMFLGLSLLVYSPFIMVTLLDILFNILILRGGASETTVALTGVIPILFSTFVGIFCSYIIFGTTTWLVIQMLAVPLRPLRSWPALMATIKNWKALLGTGTITVVITLAGWALCIAPGFVATMLFTLVTPVIMMEGLKGFAAMKRSKQLVLRSRRTTAAARPALAPHHRSRHVYHVCGAILSGLLDHVRRRRLSQGLQQRTSASRRG